MEIGINLHAIGGMTEEGYVKAMAELGFTATFCMAGKKEALERVSKL